MKKKLIEVVWPVEAINKAASREKSIHHGHPSTLHLWWSRKPLATARAVIFGSLVDDPSCHHDRFPTENEQFLERRRLFDLMEKMVVWENSNDPEILAEVHKEIQSSCGDQIPNFLDPFSGGGSIPLEAQRLGLKVEASDLNPVAVIINKAMLEIPPKFACRAPINPNSRPSSDQDDPDGQRWPRATGLAEDVAYYANELEKEAFARLGHLYPTVKLPEPNENLEPSPPSAWIWARTVKCPNQACGLQMPLTHTFTLSNKGDKKVFIEPTQVEGVIKYKIKTGKTKQISTISHNGAKCVFCQNSVSLAYIKEEVRNQRLGQDLMAIVALGPNGKVFLEPNDEHVKIAATEKVTLDSYQRIPNHVSTLNAPDHGLKYYSDLFTNRQLKLFTTIVSLINDFGDIIEKDALEAGLSSDGAELEDGGLGAKAYSQAIIVYLTVLVDKLLDRNSNVCTWDTYGHSIRGIFARQALTMAWDFAEANPFSDSSGSFKNTADWIIKSIRGFPANEPGLVTLADAQTRAFSDQLLISSEPPYYENIRYTYMSDYYYVWIRKCVKNIYKNLFVTELGHEIDDLLNIIHSQAKDKKKVIASYDVGMRRVFSNFYQYGSDDYPMTIYHALNQGESKGERQKWGVLINGLEALLTRLIGSGFTIIRSWPVKTELIEGTNKFALNAQTSSIIIVARKRPKDAGSLSRRDFQKLLSDEFRRVLGEFRRSNFDPIDLPFAVIGAGLSIYSRYAEVLEPDGSPMSVKVALSLIDEETREFIAELDRPLDEASRLCLALYYYYGYGEMPVQEAKLIAKSKNVALDELIKRRLVLSQKGTIRLLGLTETPQELRPNEDNIWLITRGLTRALEVGGMAACVQMAIELDNEDKIERARGLARRIHAVCERKNWLKEGYPYQSLDESWPEIQAEIQEFKRERDKKKLDA